MRRARTYRSRTVPFHGPRLFFVVLLLLPLLRYCYCDKSFHPVPYTHTRVLFCDRVSIRGLSSCFYECFVGPQGSRTTSGKSHIIFISKTPTLERHNSLQTQPPIEYDETLIYGSIIIGSADKVLFRVRSCSWCKCSRLTHRLNAFSCLFKED
jgi:hypothetical protein